MQEYNKTDQQLHWLSQVLAKTGRAFVPEKEDDSHTNLYFDPVAGRLCGRWIVQEKQKSMLTLNLASMQFEWLDRYFEVKHSTSVVDKSLEEIEKEVAIFPSSLGMPSEKMFEALHFEIPRYGFNSIAQKDLSDEGLRQWKFFRYLANLASLDFMGFVQAESEIRIWPHHFDTGVYTQLTPGFGLGFGLAMEDSIAGQPYFYLAGYASDQQIQYTNLPALKTGKWITGENWNGAILPLGDLDTRKLEANLSVIEGFIRSAGNWYLSQKL